MALRWSGVAVVLLLCAAVDVAAAVWVSTRRGACGRRSLVVLLLAAAVWCAAYGLELTTVGRGTRTFFGNLQYLGTTVLPPAWLVFVLAYTDRRDVLAGRRWLLLAGEPVVLLALLALPDTRHLVRSFPPGPLPPVPVVSLGPVYWVHLGYTTALSLAATALLAARLLRISPLYRRQALTLVVAVALPLLANLASSLGTPPADRYDPTPVAASLGGLTLVWGVFRYRLLDLLPVARTLVFERLHDPAIVLDAYGRIVDRNPAASRLFPAGVGIGSPVSLLIQEHVAVLDATAAGAEIRLDRPDGALEYEVTVSPLGVPDRPAGQLMLLRDITARKRAERQLRWLADYDQLTELPNRRLLAERLEAAIARAGRTATRCGLLLVDLDRFKLINDSLGHAVGDEVLACVAARLRRCVADGDTVARMGGDEFALVLPDLPAEGAAERAATVAAGVLARVAEPVRLDGRELRVTASVGIATWPEDAADARHLVSGADAALYRAKAGGRNRARSGTGTEGEATDRRLRLGVDLWHALGGGELREGPDGEPGGPDQQLHLVYQPMVDLAGNGVLAMEALLRWRHPQLGLLLPAVFLPVAAETGLSEAIDRWVLAAACAQARRWVRAGRPVRVAVNVSAERFRDHPPTLCADVAAVLRRTALPPRLLILEVNERTIIEDPCPAARELLDLRALGVGVALDDFGVGHTSLTHLRRLPVQIVKLDRELTRGVGRDRDEANIVSAIATLAHILGMSVVAEGVERAEQVLGLRASGCDALQGYFIGGPLPPDMVAGWLPGGGGIGPRRVVPAIAPRRPEHPPVRA